MDISEGSPKITSEEDFRLFTRGKIQGLISFIQFQNVLTIKGEIGEDKAKAAISSKKIAAMDEIIEAYRQIGVK